MTAMIDLATFIGFYLVACAATFYLVWLYVRGEE